MQCAVQSSSPALDGVGVCACGGVLEMEGVVHGGVGVAWAVRGVKEGLRHLAPPGRRGAP